jgi:hypothetical protein
MRVTCSQCTSEFDKSANEVRRSKTGRHFCGKSCAATYNNRAESKRHRSPAPICMGCHERSALPRRRYCSNACRDENRCNRELIKRSNLASGTWRPYVDKRCTELDWPQIQAYYDQGHTVHECYAHFAIDARIVLQAQGSGLFVARTQREASRLRRTITDKEMFCADSKITRAAVRRRILQDALIPYECSECEMDPRWRGKPMSLILDHINGVNNDHRLDNLRFLCGNCNQQTPTFCGRNLAYQRERSLTS